MYKRSTISKESQGLEGNGKIPRVEKVSLSLVVASVGQVVLTEAFFKVFYVTKRFDREAENSSSVTGDGISAIGPSSMCSEGRTLKSGWCLSQACQGQPM